MKIKIIVIVLVVVLGLLVVAVVAIGTHLGVIVKAAVESAGPKVTKTTVTVDTVNLSVLAGSAALDNLVLGNPSGYRSPHSLVVSNAAIGLETTSLFKSKVLVRSVAIHGLEVTFEGNPFGANNLMEILANVEGSSGSTSNSAPTPAPPPTVVSNAPAQPSKRFEVDSLVITGAKLHANLTGIVNREVTLPIPDIQLTALGQDPQGITAAQLTDQVLGAIVRESVKSLVVYVAGLGKNVTNAAKGAALDLLKNAGGSATNEVNRLREGLNGLLGK